MRLSFNQSNPNSQKYKHGKLKHTITIYLTKKIKKYSHFQTNIPTIKTLFWILYYTILTFSERYYQMILLRVHIKQYSHFQRVTTKQE